MQRGQAGCCVAFSLLCAVIVTSQIPPRVSQFARCSTLFHLIHLCTTDTSDPIRRRQNTSLLTCLRIMEWDYKAGISIPHGAVTMKIEFFGREPMTNGPLEVRHNLQLDPSHARLMPVQTRTSSYNPKKVARLPQAAAGGKFINYVAFNKYLY